MRPSLKRLFHYRPRFLTLVVLAAVAALLVLANLSEDVRTRRMPTPPPKTEAELRASLVFDTREPPDDNPSFNGAFSLSYGWPLLWRQYVVEVGFQVGVASVVYGELHSTGRLAANVLMWLMMLTAPTIVCEWLLRRYRPRLRWSLRTMLVVVGLVAAGCGWFVSARNRIKIEKPLIAAIERARGSVWVDRFGPDWLELVGADPWRRRVVGADLGQGNDARTERLLQRLAKLPHFQYLFVNVDHWTPGMSSAVGKMRQLRTLTIEIDAAEKSLGETLAEILADKRELRGLRIDLSGWSDHNPEQTSRELLVAIGKLTQLESLTLGPNKIASESLPHLAGLTNLKSLTLQSVVLDPYDPARKPCLLSDLPALPHLEAIDLDRSDVDDRDLACLARLPRLKFLDLVGTLVSPAGLAKLAPSESLRELTIGIEMVTAEIESIGALERLRVLHITGFHGVSSPGELLQRDQLPYASEDDIVECLQALEALRKSKPDLVIQGGANAFGWAQRAVMPSRYDMLNDRSSFARSILREWKAEQAEKQAAVGQN
jgi:hypothetical protein